MSWLLPVPMLLVAVAVALAFVPALVRRPTSGTRLVSEVLVVTLSAVAVAWMGWLMLWRVERRW